MASFTLPREMVYRPCMVDGKKAIFHRWAVDEEVLIKFDGFIKNDKLATLCRAIKEDRIVPPNTETEKLTNTYGIVEFEDGEVRGVRPVEIRFLDSEGLFKDYDWSGVYCRYDVFVVNTQYELDISPQYVNVDS